MPSCKICDNVNIALRFPKDVCFHRIGLAVTGLVQNPSDRESTTVRPRFSWNLQDCKIVVWKDTQTPNLRLKLIFTMLKKRLNLNTKTFFFLDRPKKRGGSPCGKKESKAPFDRKFQGFCDILNGV